MELYRSHVLVCGGTGCSSSGSAKLIERFGWSAAVPAVLLPVPRS